MKVRLYFDRGDFLEFSITDMQSMKNLLEESITKPWVYIENLKQDINFHLVKRVQYIEETTEN